MEKSLGIREKIGSPLLQRRINMKIWASNELILTVLLGKEKESKRMKGIFENTMETLTKHLQALNPK